MASRIDPDVAPKPAAPPVKPAQAAAKPAAPAAKPAKPAASAPAAKAPPPAAADHDDEHAGGRRIGAGFLKQTPAWAVSMLVHIVALLAMALMVTPAPEKEKVRVITSSAPDVEDNFEDPVEEKIEQTEQTEVADVVVPTDVAVVEDVKVVSDANDVDAAPLAVELTDFGSQTAPASDMMASIGAVGGTGAGGLGGRANAKALAARGGGGADTEAAVDRALKWLIAHQMPDGGWHFNLKLCPACGGKCTRGGEKHHSEDRCAATALAILPFLGRGYTHKEGPYKQQLEAGIAFLATMSQKGNGKVYGQGGSMYSQGLAGIALSESYAMTQDPRLAMPAQLALNFIMQAQDPVGGGWRYAPKQPGDTSAVGWQLMALKSGHMAYLQIDPLVIKKATDFLDSVQDDDGAFYGYVDPGKGPSTTAVGLLCRMYLGWTKDHPALQRGVDWLAKKGPNGDLYYSYYATQIMHHMEGDTWTEWNNKMKGLLLKTQSMKDHETGSWYEGVDGGHANVGRLYCTAMATMILEVYYRHLPLYGNQSVEAEFKE